MTTKCNCTICGMLKGHIMIGDVTYVCLKCGTENKHYAVTTRYEALVYVDDVPYHRLLYLDGPLCCEECGERIEDMRYECVTVLADLLFAEVMNDE